METYRTTFTVKRLWIILAVSMAIMFSILLFFGQKIYQQAPPIPDRIETEQGKLLFSGDDILRGQNVWQALGGMQQGSIWGHGSYLAPDWSADWLHREAEALLDVLGERPSIIGISSPQSQRVVLETEMRQALRTNTYSNVNQSITVSKERSKAIQVVASHYKALFQG